MQNTKIPLVVSSLQKVELNWCPKLLYNAHLQVSGVSKNDKNRKILYGGSVLFSVNYQTFNFKINCIKIKPTLLVLILYSTLIYLPPS